MLAYRATTEEIAVTVRPCFLDEESDPLTRRFAFGLSVEIDNRSSRQVQLLRREWFVRDANGRTRGNEQIRTPDRVVSIGPGTRERLTSVCVIPTFRGALEGSLLLEQSTGERFRASVPVVHLRALVN